MAHSTPEVTLREMRRKGEGPNQVEIYLSLQNTQGKIQEAFCQGGEEEIETEFTSEEPG